jgi:hypothetical protein
MPSPFQNRTPNIAGNSQLRDPQREAYGHLVDFAQEITDEREVGIVLPVGCGKSGTIAIAPFAFRSVRTLVVAPNVAIAKQLFRDVDLSGNSHFYSARRVLDGQPYLSLSRSAVRPSTGRISMNPRLWSRTFSSFRDQKAT